MPGVCVCVYVIVFAKFIFQPLRRLSSTPDRGRCVSFLYFSQYKDYFQSLAGVAVLVFCVVSILFFIKNLFQLKIKDMFKANNKAVSLMLFLVYLLLTLNITITFSSVVCKKAFFHLRMAIMAITIYINATVIMTMNMIIL